MIISIRLGVGDDVRDGACGWRRIGGLALDERVDDDTEHGGADDEREDNEESHDDALPSPTTFETSGVPWITGGDGLDLIEADARSSGC